MEDKRVSDLPAALEIKDADLFLLEQEGEAKNLPGNLLNQLLLSRAQQILNLIPKLVNLHCMYDSGEIAINMNTQDGQSIAGTLAIGDDGTPTSYTEAGVVCSMTFVNFDAI